MASQMKLNARNDPVSPGVGGAFYANFFRTFADLLKRLQGRCYRENGVVVAASPQRIILGSEPARSDTRLYTMDGNGKGVRRWATNAFPNSPRCLAHKAALTRSFTVCS